MDNETVIRQEEFGRTISLKEARETFEKYPFVAGLWKKVPWLKRFAAKKKTLPIGKNMLEVFLDFVDSFDLTAFRYVNYGRDNAYTDGASGLYERRDLVIARAQSLPQRNNEVEVTLVGGSSYDPVISPVCGIGYDLFVGFSLNGKDRKFVPREATSKLSFEYFGRKDEAFPLRSRDYDAIVRVTGKSINEMIDDDTASPEITLKLNGGGWEVGVKANCFYNRLLKERK